MSKINKQEGKLPKGVAWYCKKHKTFADTFTVPCAYCGYPFVVKKQVKKPKMLKIKEEILEKFLDTARLYFEDLGVDDINAVRQASKLGIVFIGAIAKAEQRGREEERNLSKNYKYCQCFRGGGGILTEVCQLCHKEINLGGGRSNE